VSAWLESSARQGQTIGFDPRLHSPDAVERLRAAAARAGARLEPVSPNPLDEAWGGERPPQPKAPVVPHPLEYAGEESASKRARVGEIIESEGADAAVLTAPASIAWLFNIRGGDVIRSPLPLSQAVLRKDGTARLFLDPDKVTPELPAWLGNQVSLEPDTALPQALDELKGQRVLVDPSQSAAWYSDTLKDAGATVIRAQDPTALPRACKNPTEIQGARAAHRTDGVALAGFLHWLATEAQASLPDEGEVVKRLEAFREASGALKDLSFDTIAGAGPNGAICHYRPTHKSIRKSELGTLLLVDSGAQYLTGTTDVTRTVAMGEPTAEMRDRFTRVLKGHLALARVRFPAGTSGHALDALARVPLWEAGLDYDHGTGHGVGSYLGVHEGPQRIAKLPNKVALRPGMIVSNEPGYYKTGEYGIRIENLQFVTPPADVPGGERPMMSFEALTLAPIDRRLVDKALLTAVELDQLNAYHARVLAEIGPKVSAEVREWLEQACAPL
jgi:Xaa-Pro aminopeptidase